MLAEKGSPLTLEVTAAKLGEVALVALPGEMFGAYGRRVHEQSPGQPTLVMELCFDDIRYVPTPDAMTGGGYETWNSLLPVAAGDTMVGAALDVLWGRQQS